MKMPKFRRLRPLLLGVLLFAGSTPAMAAAPVAAIAEPAQVWFLRPSSAASEIFGAAPMIYANGAPIGTIPANSDFHRDYAPGTYSFTVQPYGIATGETTRLQLASGSRTYLEVQWVPNWEEGLPTVGPAPDSHSFYLINMPPQMARANLTGLTSLGRG
jgi:hypothetical protein